MKALAQKYPFPTNSHFIEKSMQVHKERVKAARKCVDNDPPQYFLENHERKNPIRKLMAKAAADEGLRRENFLLAQRIFKIMQGESEITAQINHNDHIENHPGTMNFRQRLEEAQRVHQKNLQFAVRMQSIQPYYKMEDIAVTRPTHHHTRPTPPGLSSKQGRRHRGKKSRAIREYEQALQMNAGDTPHTNNNNGQGSPLGLYMLGSRDSTDGNGSRHPNDEFTDSKRFRSVLLEYTKTQDNRLLDIVVLKEPFRDRYAIFGLDADGGQRYELRLSSEDVSSILDGDILVTSVEHVEVWMALLAKVKLRPVEDFNQQPFSPEELDLVSRNSRRRQHLDKEVAEYDRRQQELLQVEEATAEEEVITPFPTTRALLQSKPARETTKQVDSPREEANQAVLKEVSLKDQQMASAAVAAASNIVPPPENDPEPPLPIVKNDREDLNKAVEELVKQSAPPANMSPSSTGGKRGGGGGVSPRLQPVPPANKKDKEVDKVVPTRPSNNRPSILSNAQGQLPSFRGGRVIAAVAAVASALTGGGGRESTSVAGSVEKQASISSHSDAASKNNNKNNNKSNDKNDDKNDDNNQKQSIEATSATSAAAVVEEATEVVMKEASVELPIKETPVAASVAVSVVSAVEAVAIEATGEATMESSNSKISNCTSSLSLLVNDVVAQALAQALSSLEERRTSDDHDVKAPLAKKAVAFTDKKPSPKSTVVATGKSTAQQQSSNSSMASANSKGNATAAANNKAKKKDFNGGGNSSVATSNSGSDASSPSKAPSKSSGSSGTNNNSKTQKKKTATATMTKNSAESSVAEEHNESIVEEEESESQPSQQVQSKLSAEKDQSVAEASVNASGSGNDGYEDDFTT